MPKAKKAKRTIGKAPASRGGGFGRFKCLGAAWGTCQHKKGSDGKFVSCTSMRFPAGRYNVTGKGFRCFDTKSGKYVKQGRCMRCPSSVK